LITFTVPGEAAPQGSKRAVRSRNGRILLLESSAKVKPYRAVFHYTSKGILKATAPVSPRRPDLDKACRAALDAMTGVVYVDDSQVAILSACKEYGDRAETIVKVWA
jgi:hypothetical protein